MQGRARTRCCHWNRRCLFTATDSTDAKHATGSMLSAAGMQRCMQNRATTLEIAEIKCVRVALRIAGNCWSSDRRMWVPVGCLHHRPGFGDILRPGYARNGEGGAEIYINIHRSSTSRRTWPSSSALLLRCHGRDSYNEGPGNDVLRYDMRVFISIIIITQNRNIHISKCLQDWGCISCFINDVVPINFQVSTNEESTLPMVGCSLVRSVGFCCWKLSHFICYTFLLGKHPWSNYSNQISWGVFSYHAKHGIGWCDWNLRCITFSEIIKTSTLRCASLAF